MAMDADLGIDSIKRVEILSALQERLPEAPQVKPEHLGTLHNLRDIAAFLADHPTAVAKRQDGGVTAQAGNENSGTDAPRTPALERSIASRAPNERNRQSAIRSHRAEIWFASEDAELAAPWQSVYARKGYRPRRQRSPALRRIERPATLGGHW